jgi:lipoprotein-releasing system permease protein
MGQSPLAIMLIFTLQGLLIGLIALVIGLASGFIVVNKINEIFNLIENVINYLLNLIGRGSRVALLSGDGYYLNGIPTQIMLSDVIIIILVSLSSSLVASYLAARHASRLRPLEVLQHNK